MRPASRASVQISLGHMWLFPFRLARSDVGLTRRRSVDCVEGCDEVGIQFEGIRLAELEGVVRLRGDVDADDFEPRPVATCGGPSGATEQVE